MKRFFLGAWVSAAFLAALGVGIRDPTVAMAVFGAGMFL